MILKFTREINRKVRSWKFVHLCIWCVWYRYNRAIQSVLSLSLSLSTIVLSLSFHF